MKINKALVVGTLAVASLVFVGCGGTVEKAAKTDFSNITFDGYYTTEGQVYRAQGGMKLSDLNGETPSKSNGNTSSGNTSGNNKPDVIINDSPKSSNSNNSGTTSN